VIEFGIPYLRADLLADVVPTTTYAGGVITAPASTLVIWRTCATEKVQGCTLAFYVDDVRLESLWRRPRHYTELFLRHGIAALIEVDYSLWADDALAVQVFNTYRSRWLGRYWQNHGLRVIPSLNWSDERSFPFCFQGIPVGAPVVACECRTPGGNDQDRQAFLRGLAEGLRQVQPHHLLIYGGAEHAFWLRDHVPQEPHYTLLPSWTSERDRLRKREQRTLIDRDQLNLFVKGEPLCTDTMPAPA
jgi:hypothetical protein